MKLGEYVGATKPPYPTLFLRRVANDGLLSYGTKCFALGMIPYFLGWPVTFVSGALPIFASDWMFLVLSLAATLGFIGVIHASKHIDKAVANVSKTMDLSERDLRVFRENARKEMWTYQPMVSKWRKLSPFRWYLLHVSSPIIFLVVLGSFNVFGCPWIKLDYSYSSWISLSYYFSWLVLMGYIIGASVNRLCYYAFLINDYCKGFLLSHESKLSLLDLGKIEGLKPLGRLSLLFVLPISIVPTIVILLSIVNGMFLNRTGLSMFISPLTYFVLVGYSTFLVFVFFFPMRHLHSLLMRAKKRDLVTLMDHVCVACHNTDLNTMANGLIARQHVKGSPTWPFDMELMTKVFITILFPIIAGAIFQCLVEALIKGGLVG